MTRTMIEERESGRSIVEEGVLYLFEGAETPLKRPCGFGENDTHVPYSYNQGQPIESWPRLKAQQHRTPYPRYAGRMLSTPKPKQQIRIKK
jgi:hypothetical protein